LKRAERERRARYGGREVVVWRYRAAASTCQACPLRQQCTTSQTSGRSLRRSEHEDPIVAHRAWMASDEAKSVYRLRGQTIEIVFADIKEHRGLRRFSGHGLARARTEYALEVLLHNLLVRHRFLSQRRNTEAMHHIHHRTNL
jgi:Transposase DDE domain